MLNFCELPQNASLFYQFCVCVLTPGRHDNEDDNIALDVKQGVPGILRQVVGVVCRQDGANKSRRLGYLNSAVRAIAKVLKASQVKKPLFSDRVIAKDDPEKSTNHERSLSSQVDFGEEEITKKQYFCL